MGMRGINASPKPTSRGRPSTKLLHSWDAPGLSPAERVIRFVNSLPCTQGPLAGTNLKLRPWQTKFIKAVYRCDKQGNRTVRTA
ncbi:MAG: terminase large subunit, partial [Pseudolabrys sp.]